MTQSNGGPAGNKNKKKSDGEEEEVNIEELMNDIRQDIIGAYKVFGENQAFDAKRSIDILHDIEVRMKEYLKFIDYVAKETNLREHVTK